ncbi:hypothetical protein [Candidatus Hydrogenosomobacter endosymbioticus]|uniref:hypothetical protein n=1 Tax=Candidatus Hydrogenosomobacter endosymbioticus TaxID=2558174 RepID=UPI001F383A27|nr:hypothetical protein [Candidatus Hydrogenosomobacter endosymbioticus]
MIAACTFIVLAEKLKTPGFEQEKPGTHSMPRTKIDSWKKQAARKISKILSHSAVCTSIISACAAYLLYKIWAFYCATSTQKDFGFFIKLTEFFRFGFAVYGAILVTSAVTWWKALVRTNTTATEFSQIYKRRLFLCVVCVCSCAISILGTACCISDMVLYSMAVFSLPIIVAITDITSLFSKNLFVYYVFCAISFFFVFPRIAVFQTLNNRHPFPTAKSKNSSFLKFVSVRQEFADSVDSLISTLEKVGFDFEKDRIVASYLAGYVCASGAKTLGNPFQFYFEGMPESFDMFSCAFLKLELGKNIRKVYLLLSEKEPLGKSVQNMLHKFLTADRKFKSLYIGIGPSNTMIEDGSKLYLMGPYTFNKNTQR